MTHKYSHKKADPGQPAQSLMWRLSWQLKLRRSCELTCKMSRSRLRKMGLVLIPGLKIPGEITSLTACKELAHILSSHALHTVCLHPVGRLL